MLPRHADYKSSCSVAAPVTPASIKGGSLESNIVWTLDLTAVPKPASQLLYSTPQNFETHS